MYMEKVKTPGAAFFFFREDGEGGFGGQCGLSRLRLAKEYVNARLCLCSVCACVRLRWAALMAKGLSDRSAHC